MRLNLLTAITPVLGLALFGAMAVVYVTDYELYQRILATDGVGAFRYPFLDWEYIGAAAECWKRGVDVYIANTCDVLQRAHTYSPVWLRATFIPSGRMWTVIIALCLDISFLLSLPLVFKPANWREAVAFIAACTSTGVVFALERANIDVLLFIIVVIAGVLLTGPSTSRLASYALLLLAGLLKFYPFVAMVTALRERPRAFIAVALTSSCVILAFAFGYRQELVAMSRNLPQNSAEMDVFGAKNLLIGFAAAVHQLAPEFRQSSAFEILDGALIAILLILTGAQAVLLGRRPGLSLAYARMAPRDQIILTIGSALIVGCFFAGQNVEYRDVYLILVVAGLMALRRAADETPIRTRLAGVTFVVVFLMWEALFRHALAPNGSAPEGLSLPYHLFWLLRELLWWYLASVLVGVLAIFIRQSTTFVTGMRWLTRRR